MKVYYDIIKIKKPQKAGKKISPAEAYSS